jgi:hypothetical protein
MTAKRQSGDSVRLVGGLDKKKAYGCGTSTGTSGGGSLVASSSAGRGEAPRSVHLRQHYELIVGDDLHALSPCYLHVIILLDQM